MIGSSASVSFDSDGGSGTMSPVSVTLDSQYSLPECSFEPPAGRYFEGWSLDSDPDTVLKPGDPVVVDRPLVARAVWGSIIYTVSFLPGDGSGTMGSVQAVYGQELVLPGCAFDAPDGKGFAGWSADGKRYRPGDVYVVHGNADIEAQWDRGTDIMTIAGILILLLLLALVCVYACGRMRERSR